MAKKKGKKKDKNKKQQTNNCANNTNVNIEEKLVRAIELAKEIHDENKEPEKTLPKISFWKKVKYIITNKTDDGTISLTDSLAGLMSLFFNAVAWILFITGLLCFAMIFVVIVQATNYQYLFSYIILAVLLPMLSLIMRGIANEIGREKDKNYIIAAFSGIVSFVALIVALIALFKEVG